MRRFQLADEMEQELCSDDPWLVLHKIDSPTKMRFIGNRVSECSFEDSSKVAPSIAPFLKREFPSCGNAMVCPPSSLN